MAHNLTESSTFTANVPVPDDGDFVNEGSVETAFQALANRTKFLKDAGEADADDLSDLALNVGVHFLSTVQARPVITSAGAVTWWTGTGVLFGGGALVSRLNKPTDACGIGWDIPIAIGAKLTALRALVIPGTGRSGGNRMEFDLYEQDTTTWAFMPAAGVSTVEDAGGTSLQWITQVLPGGEVVGTSALRYFATVLPGAASGSDIVYGVEYTIAAV